MPQGAARTSSRMSVRDDRTGLDLVTHPTDPDRALWKVARLLDSDVRELFDDHGNLRRVHQLPEHLAAAIASIKIVRRKTHIIQKVRFWDKPKALRMLLTHFGLLREGVDLSGGAELVNVR